MAFCPECGKAAAAEASRCVHCGFEFESKAAGKPGSRFKGTMMMAVQPKAEAAKAPAAAPAPEPVIATAPTPAAPAPAPAAAPTAAAPYASKPSAAKATVIGTGVNAAAVAAAAAAARAGAQPAAARPAAQAAAAPASHAVAARPEESKRNMALAQTQLGAAISPPVAAPATRAQAAAAAAAAVAPAQPVAEPIATPRAEAALTPPVEAVAAAHGDAFGTTGPSVGNAAEGDLQSSSSYASDGDEDFAVAPRKPMLRYDDSMPMLPRQNPLADKRTVMMVGIAIGAVCLLLLIVLAAKMC